MSTRTAPSRVRQRPRPTRVVVAAAVATAALLAAAPAPVTATPIGDAATQARALAAQVQRLQTRAEVASEHYNAVNTRLAGVVTSMISASARVDDLGQEDAAASAEATRRISALYKAGGALGLYATLLEGGSPDDMVTRLRNVQSIVDDDVARDASLDQQVADAAAAKANLQALAAERTDLERQAEAARDEVESALASREAALDAANTEVKRLADEQAAQARAAAEAAATDALGTTITLPSDQAPGNPYAEAAMTAALSKVGLPYVWGGTGPNGYDCSGLVQWAYRQAGLSITRVAADQYRSGPEVALSAIAPGDLVFWATDPSRKSTIHHVAMYLGGGKMIEAPHTGAFVRVVPLRLGPEFAGAVRPGLASPASSTP